MGGEPVAKATSIPPGSPAAARGWRAAVVIPAHDEASTIGACLASVLASLAAASAVDQWIVVVADRCSDATAAVARQALGSSGEVVEVDAGNVGQARAIGSRVALAHLDIDDVAQQRSGADRAERTWLLTTDADTAVPRDWVTEHLRLADAGAAAVAGIVRIDSFADHPAHVEPRHQRAYVVNADGTHAHVHGANLGVRADAYRAIGGWSPLRTAEDHDLWDRLAAGGWPTVSSIESWVITSGRALGRAPEGLAWRLGTYGAVP